MGDAEVGFRHGCLQRAQLPEDGARDIPDRAAGRLCASYRSEATIHGPKCAKRGAKRVPRDLDQGRWCAIREAGSGLPPMRYGRLWECNTFTGILLSPTHSWFCMIWASLHVLSVGQDRGETVASIDLEIHQQLPVLISAKK